MASGELRIRGRELRSRRLRALLSQAELGRAAGLSPRTIGYYESGATARVASVRSVARALDCDPFDIAEIVEEASA
jgi:transcriptional regulator with XRE-family HTH domain